ncbi:hypothetical protein AB0I81_17620 [Nonomuraea sp. NPDC050404]|uniref:hypothetical protein n=1 Tax=Nonomuraea sp. NPDC050404 TaxID=3155783 RepID=UPI0033E90932
MRRPSAATVKRLAALVGGRAAFRATLLLANLALLAAWGQPEYAGYAQAMGSAAVLSAIAATGIEKCALKLIPRLRHTVPMLVGIFVTLAGALLVVALAVLGGMLALGSGGPWPLVTLAGLSSICLGLNQVLLGLARAIGKPGRDVANHLVLSAALACWTGAALLLGITPVTFLALYAGTLAVLNLALLAGMRPDFGGLRRGTLTRVAVGTSLRMAVPDLAGGLTMSLMFLALSVAGAQAESTGLYMAATASSILLNAFSYLLRILQPEVSRALHQRDLSTAYERMSHWLRLLMLAGTPYVLVALAVTLAMLRPYGDVGVVILYVACVPVIFAVGSANYLMENATRQALNATAAGAAVALAVVGALALVVVPWTGALGAVALIAFGELIHAGAILRWLRPRTRQLMGV